MKTSESENTVGVSLFHSALYLDIPMFLERKQARYSLIPSHPYTPSPSHPPTSYLLPPTSYLLPPTSYLLPPSKPNPIALHRTESSPKHINPASLPLCLPTYRACITRSSRFLPLHTYIHTYMKYATSHASHVTSPLTLALALALASQVKRSPN